MIALALACGPRAALRRRADDRPRRHRPGRDPQPAAGPADRPLHGDGARHPRPRRRRRAHRRDRRHVRRAHRRAGAAPRCCSRRCATRTPRRCCGRSRRSRTRATPGCASITGRPPDLLNPPPGCSFAPRCPYVGDRCRTEVPGSRSTGSQGHRFACFHPLGSPENAEALERNLAAGLPQAVALLDSKDGSEVDLDRAARCRDGHREHGLGRHHGRRRPRGRVGAPDGSARRMSHRRLVDGGPAHGPERHGAGGPFHEPSLGEQCSEADTE